MWWEPQDAETERLQGDVRRLAESYRSYLTDNDDADLLAYGVGATLTVDGTWAPLVLAGREFLDRDRTAFPEAPLRLGLLSDLLPRHRLTTSLRGWDATSETIVLPVHRPRSACSVSTGDQARADADTDAFATVGMVGFTPIGEPAMVTAGHLVHGNGDRVNIRGRCGGQYRQYPGEVVAWSDPASNSPAAGLDYAVVTVDPFVRQLSHNGTMASPRPPYIPMNVAGTGAVSGYQVGTVSGALTQVGDRHRQWQDCWMLGPCHLLRPGDSGTLVQGRLPGGHADALFGHFVGGSGWPGQSVFHHLYVQDLEQTLNGGLANSFQMFPPT
ncbi:hypothetical protein HH310_11090 [Actinoplanes sp. TBRC 11911]|uniref:hypothetical protein n=1 Tax=Actinoplanes sp. TBRC 11911 TaxID=2729386 RepID=UPI00145DFE97|nr:hypothetical protein [Actinoplanes sp. TBRC 11911]NMO51735.1 hypothetical protein [Actinoplanes sp. TBRC 11911]